MDNGGNMTRNRPNLISPEERPDFPSMARAKWRDTDGREHQHYIVRRMADGSGGFEVVDTHNNADHVVIAHIATREDADHYLRTHRE